MNEPVPRHCEEIDQLPAAYGGDVRVAIAALLSERELLLKELQYASIAMGHGFARGWKPKAFAPRGRP